MPYSGSCHCGALAFTVDAEPPTRAVSCNCTHCRRKGLLLTFVPEAKVAIASAAPPPKEYLFNTRTIRHQFCTECGVEPFGYGLAPNGDRICAVNLRCVSSIDLDALELDRVDGLSS